MVSAADLQSVVGKPLTFQVPEVCTEGTSEETIDTGCLLVKALQF
jgi:hypothetical protein